MAGVVGVALCAVALYTALAMALEDASRHTELPLGRRRFGTTAIGGEFDQQLESIQHEAGVREQL